MNRLTTMIAMFLPIAAVAQESALSEHLWLARPLVIFSPSQDDPRLAQQLRFIDARSDELEERDVVVIVDTATEEGSALRDEFHPRGFQLLLIGKDGQVKLRKPFPWDVRELSRAIDKMPMRRQEIEAAR